MNSFPIASEEFSFVFLCITFNVTNALENRDQPRAASRPVKMLWWWFIFNVTFASVFLSKISMAERRSITARTETNGKLRANVWGWAALLCLWSATTHRLCWLGFLDLGINELLGMDEGKNIRWTEQRCSSANLADNLENCSEWTSTMVRVRVSYKFT